MRRLTHLAFVIASILAVGGVVAQNNSNETAASTDTASQSGSDSVAKGQGSESAAASSSADSNQTRQAAAGIAIPVITLLVPVRMEEQADSALAEGCWAKLFGEQGFKGDTLTLVGPVDMPDMTGPFGVEWGEKVSSVKAGPNAKVTLYDNENYRDRAAAVRPGEQLGQISDRLGIFEEVQSMKISCDTKGGRPSG